MKMIVAADKNWGIGYKNKLLAKIPKDMEFFRKTTLNNIVVMGRTTLESLPNKLPLRNRVNIVFSKDKNYEVDGAYVVHNKTELFDLLYNTLFLENTDNVYVIGGASIYNLMLDDCDIALVTRILDTFQADTFIPNLDILPNWELIDSSEIIESNSFNFNFCTYKNNNI